MNRKEVFMRRRVETDLEELLRDPIDHRDQVDRRFVGANLGNQCAYLNFIEIPQIGLFANSHIAITILIKLDYPYAPPQVFCLEPSFNHPNKDPASGQIMFSMVDPKLWKPTFELKQIICALEMILITPEVNYTSLRSFASFSGLLNDSKGVEKGSMDAEYTREPDYSELKRLSKLDCCSNWQPMYVDRDALSTSSTSIFNEDPDDSDQLFKKPMTKMKRVSTFDLQLDGA